MVQTTNSNYLEGQDLCGLKSEFKANLIELVRPWLKLKSKNNKSWGYRSVLRENV